MDQNNNIKYKDLINDEEKIEFNISVSDFDVSIAELTSVEDMTPKMIQYIEKQIRNSFEYRNYVQYLKDELDLTKCSLLPNIDIKTTPVSLEMHHFPFTLYDVTDIIGRSMIDKEQGNPVSCFDISERVMEEHFKNNIGLVPLTETLHQMAHNNAIVIPLDKVNGNYKQFITDYERYIPENTIEKINNVEMYNKTDEAKEFNKNKLKKKIANYNIEYKKEDDTNV
jgi:hypothetical protein